MTPGGSSSRLRFPLWEREYNAVLSETNTTAMFRSVEAAEAAVRTRRASLEGRSDHYAERDAIEEALLRLDDIKRNRLRFR